MKLKKSLVSIIITCATITGPLASPSIAEAAAKPGVVIDYEIMPVPVQVRPKVIRPFKDVYYSRIRWTKLTETTGYAFAARYINTCQPSCADANYKRDRVQLKFTRVRFTSTHRRVFTRLKITTVKNHQVTRHDLPLR